MFNQILMLLIDGILMGSIYAVFALGLSLLWGVMGILNAAQGEMFTLGALIFLFSSDLVGPVLALFLVAPIMFTIGIVIDQSIFRQLRRKVPPGMMGRMSVIITIALSLFFVNLYLATIKGDFWKRTIPILGGNVNLFGIEYTVDRLLVAGLSLLLTGLLALFLKSTRTGKAIRAVSQDREKAMLVGINTERIYLVTWGIGALLAGMAGALISPIFVVQPLMGTFMLSFGFGSVLIGGMGSLVGTMIGAYTVSIVTGFTGFYISNVYKEVFAFLVMLIVLIWKGEGLFAKS